MPRISRRDALAGAGAAAVGLGLPGAAGAAMGASGAVAAPIGPSPFIKGLAAVRALDFGWTGDDDEFNERLEVAELQVAKAPIVTAEDALAAFDFLVDTNLIEDCRGVYGVMVDAMVEGIRQYLAAQAGQVAS